MYVFLIWVGIKPVILSTVWIISTHWWANELFLLIELTVLLCSDLAGSSTPCQHARFMSECVQNTTLPVYSPKQEATLPDQQAWHTGQLTSDLSFHLSRRATLQLILWLLQGHRGHSWHSSTVLCWAQRASTHQQPPFTQEISVKTNTRYVWLCMRGNMWKYISVII